MAQQIVENAPDLPFVGGDTDRRIGAFDPQVLDQQQPFDLGQRLIGHVAQLDTIHRQMQLIPL